MYVYTSSTGVYYPYLSENIDEQTKPLLVEPENIQDEDMKIEYWYGVMKANSELQAKEAFGAENTLIIRPTYMIGPADKSNRFIHWPLRMSEPGDVLIPGKNEDPFQYIDVRDVAEFTINLMEQEVSGTYNAVGPENAETISEFAIKASKAFNHEHNLLQVDDYDFLKSQRVKDIVPWIMPEGNNYGSARINNRLAQDAGLTYRPLKDSMVDTYNWWTSAELPHSFKDKYIMDSSTALAREKAILAAWSNTYRNI
jgi:2'-hydroxyisoflavone reductase